MVNRLKLSSSVFARLQSAFSGARTKTVILKQKDAQVLLQSQGGKQWSGWSRLGGVPWWTVLAMTPVVYAFGSYKKRDIVVTAATKTSSETAVVEKADELYSRNAIPELYDHLVQYKDSTNDDVMWRLCRAACDKAKMTTNKEEKKALMYEAYQYVQRALELNDKNFACHKWYAIMLDYVGEYEGTKQRISNAYKVKEHFMKAIELNPTDATSVHLLGYWCFVFAELPWYQKKVASVIFATPPSSSYEEALKYFLQAENSSPNFYSRNLLYLGRTYLRLDNKKMALLYLTRTRDYPVVTEDDKEAHKESKELLKSMGVKDTEQ